MAPPKLAVLVAEGPEWGPLPMGTGDLERHHSHLRPCLEASVLLCAPQSMTNPLAVTHPAPPVLRGGGPMAGLPANSLPTTRTSAACLAGLLQPYPGPASVIPGPVTGSEVLCLPAGLLCKPQSGISSDAVFPEGSLPRPRPQNPHEDATEEKAESPETLRPERKEPRPPRSPAYISYQTQSFTAGRPARQSLGPSLHLPTGPGPGCLPKQM